MGWLAEVHTMLKPPFAQNMSMFNDMLALYKCMQLRQKPFGRGGDVQQMTHLTIWAGSSNFAQNHPQLIHLAFQACLGERRFSSPDLTVWTRPRRTVRCDVDVRPTEGLASLGRTSRQGPLVPTGRCFSCRAAEDRPWPPNRVNPWKARVKPWVPRGPPKGASARCWGFCSLL